MFNEKVHVLDHPLLQHKLTILRDERTGVKEFREIVSEIAALECYEATRDLPLEDIEVKTPVATATFKHLAGKKLAIVPILRAGLGMVDGILNLIPSAKVGHIGLYRGMSLCWTPCWPPAAPPPPPSPSSRAMAASTSS